jgi:hypothetical protein
LRTLPALKDRPGMALYHTRFSILLAPAALLASITASCAGPHLAIRNVSLRTTANPVAPLRWTATVINDDNIGAFSLCRAGSAKAVIALDVFLARVPNDVTANMVRMHSFKFTDGGDPNTGNNFPDAMGPGHSETVFFEPEVVANLADFQFIVFEVTSRPPPFDQPSFPIANSNCHIWNVRRVERVADLLAQP